MEESERPRKLQKTAHEMTSPATAESMSTTNTVSNPDQITAEDHAAASNDYSLNITLTSIPETDENGQPLSKNQRKKLLKRERWEAGKEWRKERRKEKIIAKRERQRAAKAQAAVQEEADRENNTNLMSRTERKIFEQQRSILLPITFVIDCDFDDLMVEKERISLGSQITRSYSDNSKAPFRAHMAFSSFNKLLKERFDTVLSKQYTRWKGATFMQEDYVVAAEQAKERMRKPTGGKMMGMFAGKAGASPDEGEVIYLSSDSPNTLTELKPYSTYIIGGLVDKNRHKGICYKSAMAKGIKTAKLPIGDYMQMQSRYVLATNHVVEIMIKWLELGDWGKAFCLVLPKRKGGVLKDNKVGEGGIRKMARNMVKKMVRELNLVKMMLLKMVLQALKPTSGKLLEVDR
ncbi:hypothetical protein ACJ72_06672 [Emergomyces africanus]|uniref:tRNA (guanine(9)-N1)-methyltransferase n=1 Tax=Emergomyces africanus TaxID=1955775 RepID=A0A1B7NQB3_9EURO|nr:hypothetical protein ACJ72_06672 [Emergomyces africanus]